jgi:hypothetical protein
LDVTGPGVAVISAVKLELVVSVFVQVQLTVEKTMKTKAVIINSAR